MRSTWNIRSVMAAFASRLGLPLLFIVIVITVTMLTYSKMSTQATIRTTLDSTELLDLVNDYRIANNLAPLQHDTKLDESAQQKVNDLTINDYWDHTRPNGEGFAESIKRIRGDAHYGENLARCFDTPEEVLEAWKQSPTHNELMLNPRYVYYGEGHATNVCEYTAIHLAY